MEPIRNDLCEHERDEQREEYRRTSEIPPVQRHGHGIATGLSEGCGRDLDDPEDHGDFGHLAQRGPTRLDRSWRIPAWFGS